MMERNRIYLKFLNVNFSTTVHNLASSAADYQHGRPAMSLLQALLFKPHEGDKFPIAIHNTLPALIREERVNTTIRKRSLNEIMTYYEP